ncbi:hypothetical protein R6Q59_025431 [Mikania micrantha]
MLCIVIQPDGLLCFSPMQNTRFKNSTSSTSLKSKRKKLGLIGNGLVYRAFSTLSLLDRGVFDFSYLIFILFLHIVVAAMYLVLFFCFCIGELLGAVLKSS